MLVLLLVAMQNLRVEIIWSVCTDFSLCTIPHQLGPAHFLMRVTLEMAHGIPHSHKDPVLSAATQWEAPHMQLSPGPAESRPVTQGCFRGDSAPRGWPMRDMTLERTSRERVYPSPPIMDCFEMQHMASQMSHQTKQSAVPFVTLQSAW